MCALPSGSKGWFYFSNIMFSSLPLTGNVHELSFQAFSLHLYLFLFISQFILFPAFTSSLLVQGLHEQQRFSFFLGYKKWKIKDGTKDTLVTKITITSLKRNFQNNREIFQNKFQNCILNFKKFKIQNFEFFKIFQN